MGYVGKPVTIGVVSPNRRKFRQASFHDISGPDRIRNGWQPLFTLFQHQVSHHRVQIDRMSAAAEVS
jgi:hypothetical protein